MGFRGNAHIACFSARLGTSVTSSHRLAANSHGLWQILPDFTILRIPTPQNVATMPGSMKSRVDSLSPRQREIVRLTSLGCTSHEIATILGMSRWTVENHQFQAKERLGVSKAAVLTRIAIKYKISPLNDDLSAAEKRKLEKKAAPQKKAPRKKSR
jgi:DNA-binding CsgD family transcriptional regulator